MMKELKNKFAGASSNKKPAKKQDGENEASHDNEQAQEEMDDGRLTLGDLFSSIGKGKDSSNATTEVIINTNRL